MQNEEVGVLPEDTESQAERIYIVPLLEDKELHNIRIFILADGNNRAQLEGKNYNDGGKNVVRIAEALAERGDVSMMIACLLSPDNIEKRSDDFFFQIYQAFLHLAGNMKQNGTLINKGIKLGVAGDLSRLKAKGGYAAKLADAIEQVICLTTKIDKPRMRLLFGIDYAEDIAQQKNVNVMFRSGMESKDSVRSSGIRLHPRIPFYGTDTLWPNVAPAEIGSVIDDVKTQMEKTLESGYSAAYIRGLLEQYSTSQIDGNFTVTMRSTDAPAEFRAFLNRMMIPLEASVELVHDPNDAKKSELFPVDRADHSKAIHRFRIIPNAAVFVDDKAEYSSFLVPGQQELSHFVLPAQPRIAYATAHKCGKSPEQIIAGINKAIGFHREHKQMKGAERELGPRRMPEFDYLNLIIDNRNLSDLDRLYEPRAEELTNDDEKYNLMANLFTAKCVASAENQGFKWTSPENLRAFINYVLTGFFFCYYPNHPKWQQLKPDWETRAKTINEYMILTYLMDDYIFDAHGSPEELMKLRKMARAALTNAVDLEVNEPAIRCLPIIKKNELLLLAEGFSRLSDALKQMAHPKFYEAWKREMKQIIECMDKEWDASLVTDDQDFQSMAKSIAERTTSEVVKSSINEAICELESADECNIGLAKKKIRLFAYLEAIQHSIGSGNIYLSLACVNSKDEKFPTHSFDDLIILSGLINQYFRVANDLAEQYRQIKDRDSNISSTQLFGEESDSVLPTQFINNLMLDLRKELMAKIDEFGERYGYNKTCAAISVALKRAKIGELFYKGTHYREVRREKVGDFFKELKMVGIPSSS